MITDAEAEMGEMCDARGVSASTSSALLKAAVKALVKAEILERGIFDGGILRILDRTTFREDITSERLREFAEKKVDEYVRKSGDAAYQSSSDIATTKVRKDHEMPSVNPDQSKIPEYHDRADETNNQDTDFYDT